MAKVLYKSRPSLLSYFSFLLLGGLLVLASLTGQSLPLALGGLFFLAWAVLGRLASEYTITEDAVEEHRGILSRHSSQVEIGDIGNVQVHRSATNGLLGIGDVLISTAGQSGIEIALRGVKKPDDIVRLLKGLRAKPAGALQDQPTQPPAPTAPPTPGN